MNNKNDQRTTAGIFLAGTATYLASVERVNRGDRSGSVSVLVVEIVKRAPVCRCYAPAKLEALPTPREKVARPFLEARICASDADTNPKIPQLQDITHISRNTATANLTHGVLRSEAAPAHRPHCRQKASGCQAFQLLIGFFVSRRRVYSFVKLK
jgi:hypothetical protein